MRVAMVSMLIMGANVVGCGGTADRTVARVGNVEVTNVMLEHWTSVMLGGSSSTSHHLGSDAVQRSALELLILREWLVEGGGEEGLRPSPAEIRQWVQTKIDTSFRGERGEFDEYLKITGETTSDIELEARAALVASAVRQRLLRGVLAVTEGDVRKYYRRHRRRFWVREQRTYVVTNRKKLAEVHQLEAELAAGRKFSHAGHHVSIERPEPLEDPNGLERAIYTAKPNVIVGPVWVRPDWFLLEVKAIEPGHYLPLARVAAGIRKQLTHERQEEALSSFFDSWRAKWTLRTDCSAPYVVGNCKQSRPSTASVENVFVSAS